MRNEGCVGDGGIERKREFTKVEINCNMFGLESGTCGERND